jgi:hypothetical protein
MVSFYVSPDDQSHRGEKRGIIVNRRFFLGASGAVAACVATGGLGSSRKLFAQSVDSDLLSGAVDYHALVTASAWNGTLSPWLLTHLAHVQANVANSLQSAGIDDQIKATMAGVDPASIDLSTIDLSSFTTSVQQYAPNFQLSDAQAMWTMGGDLNSPDIITAAITQMQQYGITPTIQQTSVGYGVLAQMFTPPADGGLTYLRSPWKGRPALVKGGYTTSLPERAIYAPGRNSPILRKVAWQRAMQPAPSDGGGYSCPADGVAVVGFGTAVTVVTVMCYLTVIGAPICTVSLLVYAAVAGTVWSLGHAIKCGF